MEIIIQEHDQHWAGFFSYARRDDNHEDRRITELRQRLEGEVRMQTGEEFLLYQDQEDISAGQQWWERIKGLIDKSMVFVAVVTPTYLKRHRCREEIRLFLSREEQLNREDLIIPIRYVVTPGLKDENDVVARSLASRHYIPWEDLRFYDTDSSEVREAIADCAGQIIKAIGRLEQGAC